MAKEKKQRLTNEVLCGEYKAVYRYVLSLCRNETEAKDITQETFLKAMNAAHKFKGESSLYTWLCIIAKNTWLNQCQKRSKEVYTEDSSRLDYIGGNDKRNVVEENRTVTSMEERLMDREAALQIHRILHELNEPYKEVFSLRVFGQLAFGDIAGLFGKTESWARVTYHRAKKAIYEKMREEGYDE